MSAPPAGRSPADRSEPRPLALIGRGIDLLVTVAGMLIAVLMFGNVISRFVVNFDVAWASELTSFLMTWATFLGGAAAARRGAHMRIVEFVHLAGGRLRLALEIVIEAVVLAVLGMLVWYGWVLAAGNMDQESTVLYYPMGLQYAAVPVGAALAALYVLRDLAGLVAGRQPREAPVEV